jgi:hypothetical protein
MGVQELTQSQEPTREPISVLSRIQKWSGWRWTVFFLCLFTFGRHFDPDIGNARQYQDIAKAEWGAANVWLKSAECARQTGAWLSICDGNKLVPFSEFSPADDPGHALLLGIFARLKDRNVSLVDVARLNTALNILGFVMLTGVLFAMRAYVASLIVLPLGGVYYGLLGLSPHPSHMGLASMAAILPIVLLAKERKWISGRMGYVLLAVGLFALAVAALIRGAIGSMGFLASIGTLALIGVARYRGNHRLLDLVVVGLLVATAWQSPRWVLMARDASFTMEPASRIQSHGTSHSLYLGLGVVENRFGIRWDDSYAADAVKKVAPEVSYVSPEYYRVLWKLYFERVMEDPKEVVRIYLLKTKMLLGEHFPEWAPPLWQVLAAAIVFLCMVKILGAGRRLEFDQGFHISAIALVFIGLFTVQGALAHPRRDYSAPVGIFVLLLIGVALEFFCRSQWKRIGSEN